MSSSGYHLCLEHASSLRSTLDPLIDARKSTNRLPAEDPRRAPQRAAQDKVAQDIKQKLLKARDELARLDKHSPPQTPNEHGARDGAVKALRKTEAKLMAFGVS